ncbi:RimJ/RimL family protein N-acetyltransferase [Aliiruegeria haliotis]|uniref:RimJ/RimL family protein N-acetyltransferase n=1 Tax=Aliiruegeria haliotis TaxID=1280846 RepID=A0A2T0RTF3_9RHOB|nr:GNAT family N-acetyltransferase [Aliiruegeria haliotis]PRY24363.1 RimJ/RimL family protein N-acetyltransferase [Aliiruegeria haliotis]
MTITPAGTEIRYTVTWLEMTRRPTFPHPPLPVGKPAALLKADEPPAWFFLGLYDAVGRHYAWEDMFERPEEELEAWLKDPNTALYTLMRSGWPHGFFLLDYREAGICDIVYFGLVPQAVGRGLGRFLLESAILTAWEFPGVEKLTVNTCSLDHPRALGTYQRCGFEPVRQQEFTRVLKRPLDVSRIPS